MTTGICANANESLAGLCDILRDINPDADMTPQALSQRINNSHSVDLLNTVLIQAIEKNIEPICNEFSGDFLSSFNRVFLEDSTQCKLNNMLADEFKGSGGSASKSILKINLIYEFKKQIVQEHYITDCKESDQSMAERILDHIQVNDLIIRDLGYFTLKSLTKINKNEAYYLSRLIKSVNVYLSKDDKNCTEDLAKYFSVNFPNQSVVDLSEVYLGSKKMSSRLIAYKLPEEVVNIRRKKAKDAARKKGRKPAKEQLNWLNYGFYITNASQAILPAENIGTIYRIRWQIELIFKVWKSLLNINALRGSRPERIKCILYGRLIVIAVISMCNTFAFWYTMDQHKREVSYDKLIKWLLRLNRLKDLIHSDRKKNTLRDLLKDILTLCKQKRKRKTTYELIENQVPYQKSFDQNYQY